VKRPEYLSGWLLVLLAGSAFGADDAALRVVEACRVRLDPRTDVGFERIQRRCPELARALAKAPWRDLLPRDLADRRDELSAESLRALVVLIREAGDSEATRAAPQTEALAPVLAELGAQGQQGATRWERLKRWLEQKLENRDDDEEGLLDEWSRQLQTSEGVARAITYFGYALVAGLVIFVIAAELRAAGLLSARRRAAERANPASLWRRRLVLADVAAAPLADRPGMLLRLLGETLTRAHRLPAAEGLTASAIARRAELDDAGDRDALNRVATVADAARYAPRAPANEDLEGAVNTAQALLAKFARLMVRR
jgi:hypothetical protein